MYVIDRSREIVGYSAWPWDSIYAPVVGCFRDGRLIRSEPCNLMPQPGLAGPRHAWWFRMRVDADASARLERGDPSVQLLRLEDGVPVPSAVAAPVDAERPVHVEELVAHVAPQPQPLTGFTGFLAAPIAHQLDMLWIDLLGRPFGPDGAAAYLPSIENGMTILHLRDLVLQSEEFAGRGITASDRIGSLITSPIWTELRSGDPIGEWRRPLREIRLVRYDDLDDEDFVAAFHLDCFGYPPDADAVAWLLGATREHGREWIASVSIRDAAHGGGYSDYAVR